MLGDDEIDPYADPKRPFWQRAALPGAALVLVGFSGFFLFKLLHHGGPSPRPHHELHVLNVKLPPPPPPPPPPKTPPPPTKTEQAKAAPTKVPRPTPVKAPKAPSPPAAATTSISGNGPGALGNGNGGGGDCIGEGCGNGNGGGDAGDYYRSLVNSAVVRALEQDERLRFAHYSGVVALIFDRNGHAVSVQLQDYSGPPDTRADVVRALQQVAAGESLPSDMANGGKPWVVRFSAHARG